MNYFVIAVRWDETKGKQVKCIIGQFPQYYLASMFKEAYNEKFSANAKVVTTEELVND